MLDDDSLKEPYGGFVGSNPTRCIFINLLNYDIKLSTFSSSCRTRTPYCLTSPAALVTSETFCILLVFYFLNIWEYFFTLRSCPFHVVYYLLLVCRKLQILQNLRYCCCLWIVFDIYFFSFALYSSLLVFHCSCLSFVM